MINDDEEKALYDKFLSSWDMRFIAPAENGDPSVEFKFDGGWRECRIWEGYFDASLILMKTMLEEHPGSHNLVFPALFNLRHAIEVSLKWHIRYAGGVIPKRTGHNLNVLIEAFRETAKDLDDEASYISDGMLDNVSELASIDPLSIAFRYSTAQNGRPIEIAPQCWDLARLYFVADALSLWFDDLSNKITLSRDEKYQAYFREPEYNDTKREMGLAAN